MSKNLTRKGLAFAALVALGATVFAGAPAQADATSTAKIATSANVGTTLNTLQGASFALKTKLDPTLVSQDGKDLTKLTYLITNSSAAGLKVASVGASVGANGEFKLGSADAAADVVSADASTETTMSSYKTSKVLTVLNVKGTSKNTSDSSDIGNNVLTITSSTDAKDAAYSVTVQAFIDGNGDMKISDFEFVGAPVTINFLPVATAPVTTTLESAVLGASTIQGKIVLGGDINNQSLAGQVKIGFTKNGSTAFLKSGQTSYDTVDVAYDTGKAGLVNSVITTLASTDANSETIKSGAVYAAQAFINAVKLGTSSAVASTTVGTEASVDGTDILVATSSANVIAGTTTASNSASTTNNTTVRTGYTGDISFSSNLTSNDGSDVALAGQTVRVTLTKGTLPTGSSFTAGGVTVTSTSGAVNFTTKTDADGAVAFTGKGTGVKGDSVTVSIQVLGTNGYKYADETVVTWSDATIATPVLTGLVRGNSSTDNLIKIAKGGSYTLNVSASDNFGQPWSAAGTYQYAITATTSTGASFVVNAAATAGKASATIVDNSTTTGTYVVTAQLQKLVSSAWSNTGLGSVAATIYVNATAAAAVSATVPTSSVATTTKTLVAADLNVDNNTKTATTIGYAPVSGQTVSGTVTDALGAGVAAQTVTIAGPGLGFISASGKVYAVDSITVNADASGAYSVSVFGNKAGKATVTVTAGAATATKTITFTGVTVQASTNVLTVDAPALSQVGRSFTVTVKIVDKFGNAVSGITPTVTVTGVGSVTTAAATGTAGTSTVQFVAGANDFGDAVITAKYTASDDVVVSATKTIAVGVTDAQVDVVNNRVTAVASFSKGKTVGFYVDGVKKWSKLSASDADVVLNYNLKKGRHTVTVKISGGFITSEVIVVK
jgi:hypothetical protein